MSTSFGYGIEFTGDSAGFQMAQQQVVAGMQEITQYTITFGETQERAAQISVRGLQQVLFGTQMLTWIGGMWYSNLVRQEAATIAVAQAQENYNYAVSRYGASSMQAQRAARSLERAQLFVSRANTMAVFSFASVGMQVVQLGLSLTEQLPTILTHVSAIWAAVTAHSALKGAIVGGVIGAGLAVAGVVALQQMNTVNVNINQETDLDEAFDQAKRETIYELRR